ncbi:hypothetical protein CRP01_22390 [Flavilitoribacter nigricans DSM 23189 = NBRC 102662]|uniref:Uncharacterized protein n=1 Tax=Flavilitoribacter nigricans (strain ATCC 23147 / DSM 23189 / NBRC 102662 / NCIMB 1420 / SS-2) TaxID=1122177 RepID=A0A2D0N728_FLAN2|nr:hypothetical protein CRP01_22390 [Flavilitoribacter nigricans DSM 23189 = NBRC 102662]
MGGVIRFQIIAIRFLELNAPGPKWAGIAGTVLFLGINPYIRTNDISDDAAEQIGFPNNPSNL